MELSADLISQFVKAVTPAEKPKKETTVYGTITDDGSNVRVLLDGATKPTPVTSSVAVKANDRVTVMIKDHSAVVTGNLTDPSASSVRVTEVDNTMQQMGIVVANKITTTDLVAINATISNLIADLALIDEVYAEEIEAITGRFEEIQADFGRFDELEVDELEAIHAEIESIEGEFADFTEIDTDILNAIQAEIVRLKGYTASFTKLSAQELDAVKANIREINADKATIRNLSSTYANFDFADMTQAQIDEFYANTGIVNQITIKDGVVVSELIGVKISADSIKTNTLTVDKLVVRGNDGNYYSLSTDFAAMPGVEPVTDDAIHGSTIIAKSIVAEQIAVDDLVAFGATIGGFVIGQNRYVDENGNVHENTDSPVNSIHSFAKPLPTATTRGVYLDSSGQMGVGDETNYIRYYKDENGDYRLEVSANEISFKTTNLKVGARNLVRNSENLIFENYGFGSKRNAYVNDAGELVITNRVVTEANVVDNELVMPLAAGYTSSIEDDILIIRRGD